MTSKACRVLAVVCLTTAAGTALSDDGELPSACRLFAGDVAVVSQTLYMHQEDVSHRLSVPKVYFEDPWDRVDHGVYEAQLFSVEIEALDPVARPGTTERLRDGHREYMTFVLHDLVPMPDLLNIVVRSVDPFASRTVEGFKDAPLSLLDDVPADHGLTEFVSRKRKDPRKNVFAARDSAGNLTAILGCRPIGQSLNPNCNHAMRAHGIDVRINYRRTCLPDWARKRADVTDFIRCALTVAT
jgi:hypothetical protein